MRLLPPPGLRGASGTAVFTRGAETGAGNVPVASPGWTRQPPVGQASRVGTAEITLDPKTRLHNLVDGYFQPYADAGRQVAIAAIVDDRARWFQEQDHDAERVAQNMRKANGFDWASVATIGAVNATPFGLAGVALNTIPALLAPAAGNPAATGASVGAFAGSSDVAGMQLLSSGTGNARWLHGGMAQMEPVMQEALRERSPGLMQRSAEGALALQPYTARNLARTFAAPAAQALGGTAVRTALDTALMAGGGVVAGAASGMISRYFDQRNGMDGPAMLLGRTDWRDLYMQLDAATWAGQVGNGLARVGAFPGDIATGSLAAIRQLATPGGVAEVGLLAGGFAGVEAARHAVEQSARAAGMGEPGVQMLSHATNTLLSAPVYGALVPSVLGAGHLAETATQAIQGGGWSNTPAPSQPAGPVAVHQPYTTPGAATEDPSVALLSGAVALQPGNAGNALGTTGMASTFAGTAL